MPEQALVRHILIKAPLPGSDGKVDPKALDAAQAKANDVLKQIKAGGDFGKLAQQYSEDPGSKDTQGLLGWLQRGRARPAMCPRAATASTSCASKTSRIRTLSRSTK